MENDRTRQDDLESVRRIEARIEKKNELKAKLKAVDKKNAGAWQAFKYLLCTLSAGLIEFISFNILAFVLGAAMDTGKMTDFITKTPTYNFIATTVALALSVIWNFTLNRKVTFKSAANVPRAMFLAFLFYVPFYPFKIWFNGVLPYTIPAVHTAAAAAGITVHEYALKTGIVTVFEILSMLCNGVLEFLWQKFVIYHKNINTAAKKDEDDLLADFDYDLAA